MQIEAFKVEEWMNAYEDNARYNIAETCVDSVSLDELFELTEEDRDAFLRAFSARRLTYGAIEGTTELRSGIASLYHTVAPNEIITTHGAAGANHLALYALVNPGDHVVSVMPTYQQLYAIPASFGADVSILHLRKEDGYLPDLNELRAMVRPNTKVICINNPNNPSGALMDEKMLKSIIAIAQSVGAYVLCDEVYRHLTQSDVWSPSVADLYEKGISIGSMSKVFSLAGLRLGWIVCHDSTFRAACVSRRDYSLISCGMFDEAVSALALRHADKLLARNRAIIRENLTIVDEWVKSEPHLSYVKPQAGTTTLVYFDIPMSSRDFCTQMYHQTGAFVTPGECFEEEGAMRIGYACDKQTLIDGLAAVSAFIRGIEA